jgi:hypothetical protein
MPICKLCSSKFKNNMMIDRKIRNLQRRKYCLTCSPFGKHNTESLSRVMQNNKLQIIVCSICNRNYIYSKKAGHTKKVCNSCVVNKYKTAFKKKCVEYKGGECKICGYKKCLRALSFHHTNPKTKEFIISGAHCRKWEIIRLELDKCILLCENCHLEIHDKE